MLDVIINTNNIRTFPWYKWSLHVSPFGMCMTAAFSCLCKSQATPRSSSSHQVLGVLRSMTRSRTPPLHLLLFLLHLHLLLLPSTPLILCILPHLRLHHPPFPDLLSLPASKLQLLLVCPPPLLPPSRLLLSPREARSGTAGQALPLPCSRPHRPEPQVLRLNPTWYQPPKEQVCTTVPSFETLLKQTEAFYMDN